MEGSHTFVVSGISIGKSRVESDQVNVEVNFGTLISNNLVPEFFDEVLFLLQPQFFSFRIKSDIAVPHYTAVF